MWAVARYSRALKPLGTLQELLASPSPLEQMSTFSIGDGGDEDDFADVRKAKATAASTKDGKITKLGAVPLKPDASEAAKGELVYRDDTCRMWCNMRAVVALLFYGLLLRLCGPYTMRVSF